jgi:predicted Na+-dependent transporter
LSGGLVERECPRCHQPVEPLPLGAWCQACTRDITQRARRWARWVSLVSTLLLVLYIVLRKPAGPNAQLPLIMAVGVWYFMTYRITERLAKELVA